MLHPGSAVVATVPGARYWAFIGGLLAVPCGAIGLLAAAHVRNINQFQTVYSFLIAPIYFLSGVFIPLTDQPILGVLVQFSPFYHGVRLLQMIAWGRGSVAEAALHVAVLFLFSAVLGIWAFEMIRRKLTT
jgi:lipooligosaccharide transport system permease protein